MKIINGLVFDANHQMTAKELCFENGVITAQSQGEEYDATGCYVLPGFIDTHIHGANGVEFYLSDKDMHPALEYLSAQGVTGVLVTLGAQKPEELISRS